MRTQVGSGVLNYILANTDYRLIEVSRASVTITHTDSFTNKHAFYGSLQHPKTPFSTRLQAPGTGDSSDQTHPTHQMTIIQ